MRDGPLFGRVKMGKKRKFHIFLCWTFFLIGLGKGQDITLENRYDGFFIKKLYDKRTGQSYGRNGIQERSTFSKTFILSEPSDVSKLQIKNGPFEAHQTIPQGLVEAVQSRVHRNNTFMHRNIVFDMDVSAHIVTTNLSPKLPRLQVLVHAVPHSKGKLGGGQNRQWCAQTFVEGNGIELSSVCILQEKEQACVTGLDLPKDWWSQNGTVVSVSYSFVRIDQNNQCASASNTIIPGKVLSSAHNDTGVLKQKISVLHLTLNEESYEEWKDQDILIDVPREMFHHGDTFEIPIRLEANSDLQVFIMRARVRQGLRITGARMTDPSSQWSIHVDIKDNQKAGTVTAFVRDAKIYMKSKRVQDVFRWQMEVAEDVYDTNTGRIVWSIEYTRDGISRESYLSQDSKIISQINIHNKDLQRLVPVLKVSEILNLAILSGREQVYPLQIYAVDETESFKDVTQQTKCHSVEVDVLKVAADCSSVYVDGAESRGSHNVTIIAKSGHVTAFMDVTVWIPEDRLNIQLSDDHLSRIKNWRVADSYKRGKRSLDSYKALQDMTFKDLSESKQKRCELLRQQATVEVYTRFYIQTPKVTDYFMGSSAFLKVTDLVQSRLRMSDTRIATLNGNLIKGQDDGRTEIQILSPRNGYVLAAKEIKVGHDKVSVNGLILKLVTGLQLYVTASDQIEGALVATAVEQDQLLSEFQEGIIDVMVNFSDNTTVPLHLISSDDYFLEVVSTDPQVIRLVESKIPHQAHVVALGEGSGDLIKITLKLADNCRKKKSKHIAASALFVDVDFSQERRVYSDERFQKDAYYDTNRASGRWETSEDKKPVYTLKFPEYENKDFPKNGKFDKEESVHMIAIKDDIGEIAPTVEGAKQEPLKSKPEEGLTDLEIGMYVLVAVFCVAITVFMINCVVFFVRYKRKQKPPKANPDAISSANDWVWIGRATLERNSVYTRSSRTLMPEEDFNGNRTRPVSSSSESSRGSTTPSSAPNSNRNSTVSTYKGSECSIRITTNPLNEEGAVADPLPEETQSQGLSEGVPQWDYEALGMNYNQLLEYFDNLKESTA